MTFVNAVKSGFQNGLKFSGRSRRPEYWWFFLFVFAGALVISLIDMALFGGGRQVLTRVFQLVVFIPFLAVAWRRLQDTGRPGWWVVIPSALVVISALIAGSVSRQVFGGFVEPTATMSGDPAAMMAAGASSMLVLALAVLQVVAGAVIIWWMTRPSQKGANAYGPEPRVRAK